MLSSVHGFNIHKRYVFTTFPQGLTLQVLRRAVRVTLDAGTASVAQCATSIAIDLPDGNRKIISRNKNMSTESEIGMSVEQVKDLVAPDLFLPGGPVGVLLLHGLGGAPVEMRFLAQGLSRQGFTVLCPLLKAHGGSDLLLNTARWSDWVASATAAYDRLREHCDHIIVCGQSAGAMLGIQLAADKSRDVSGLVLCSPTFWPDGWAIPRVMQLFRIIRQRWVADLFSFSERSPYGIKDERLRRFVLESLQQDGRPLADIFGRKGGTIFEFRRLADDSRRKLAHVTVPTLVIHSREDDQASLGNALRVVRGMKGPVELIVLDDSYHLVTLDRQRGQVLDRAVSFATKLAAQVEPQAVPVKAVVAEAPRAARQG